MKTPENIADLLYQILATDRTVATIDNGNLKIVQNGQSISLPINSNSVIRSSISRF